MKIEIKTANKKRWALKYLYINQETKVALDENVLAKITFQYFHI